MFIRTANSKIVERIKDINVVAAHQFPSFGKRLATVDPIRLHPDKFYYLRNRSISALETYSANQNADAFPRLDLMNRHSTFIGDPVTIDHTEERVTGMVLDSVWVPKQIFKKTSGKLVPYVKANFEPGDIIVGDWVENILALDKVKADYEHPHLIEQIDDGEITDTSMGVFVEQSTCSVCGNVSNNPEGYCNHLASFKGRTYSGVDTQNQPHDVFEINSGLTFFEDSIIIPSALGGTAGGEGADTGAKVLEKIASTPSFDLGAYIVKRAFDEMGNSYEGDDTIEVGGKPETVEVGENIHQERKEKETENSKADQLRERVNDLVEEIQDQVEDLKSITSPDPVETTEIDETGTKASKENVSTIEIRSNNRKDFEWVIKELKTASISTDNIEMSVKVGDFYSKLEIPKDSTYKISKLIELANKENKDVVLHVISRRSFMKGQPVLIKGTVDRVLNDKVAVLTVANVSVPVSDKLTASLHDVSADQLIDLAAKKSIAVNTLYVKLAGDEIEKGDEVNIPGNVSMEPDEDGNLLISLDVDAQSKIEDKMVPIPELTVPEADVEIEEADGSSVDSFEEDPDNLPADFISAGNKNKRNATGPSAAKPKDKVPSAGNNSGKKKPDDQGFSALQKGSPKPKDKVPSAGKNGPNQFKGASVVPLTSDVIQNAINAVKKKADMPEDMSIKDFPKPNNTDKVPEKNFSEPFPKNTDKVPEGAVTTLSMLRKQIVQLRKDNTVLSTENKQLRAGNQLLTSRLKPLEIDRVVANLVKVGQLDNDANVIAAQRKELAVLYDKNTAEFRAIDKIASMQRNATKHSRKSIRTAQNNLRNRAGMVVDDFSTIESVNGYSDLDSGEFFE